MKGGTFSSGALALSLTVFGLAAMGCGSSPEVRKQKHLLRGNASLQEGNDGQALYYFEQALGIDSCFASALNNVGTVHFRAHRDEEALEYYNRVIRCDENFLPAYFNRANTLIRLRRYENALPDLDRVLNSKPDTAIAHFTLGLVYSKLRRHEDAIQSFRQAAVLDTSMALDSRVNVAAVLISMKAFDVAEAELHVCLRIDATEPNIYNSLALVKAEEGKYDSALSLINHALSLSPDEPFFLNNRGYIQILRKELDLAEADINKSIVIDPYNGWAYRNKGILYLMRGDAEESVRLLQYAVGLDSYIDRWHYYLGLAFYKLGRKGEACMQFRQSDIDGDNLVSPQLVKECDGINNF